MLLFHLEDPCHIEREKLKFLLKKFNTLELDVLQVFLFRLQIVSSFHRSLFKEDLILFTTLT